MARLRLSGRSQPISMGLTSLSDGLQGPVSRPRRYLWRVRRRRKEKELWPKYQDELGPLKSPRTIARIPRSARSPILPILGIMIQKMPLRLPRRDTKRTITERRLLLLA